jgi:hypothetical protein
MRLLSVYIPKRFRKEKIIQLYNLTSGVFNDYPEIRDDIDLKSLNNDILKILTCEEILKKYADYTKMAVTILLESGCDINRLKESLFNESYRFGQEIRNHYSIRTLEDVRLMVRIIYKLVKIDSNLKQNKNTGSRELEIKHCFFADYYSMDVCSVMSGVDEGIVAGVSGCRQLQFKHRITEGNECCRAVLE